MRDAILIWLRRARGVFLFVLVPGLLSLGDFFEAVPIRPLLERYLGLDQTTAILLWYGLFFATLKFMAASRRRGDKPEPGDKEPF